MLTVEDAAVQLGVTTRWVQEMCETGKLKAIKKSGVWDIDRQSFNRLAKRDRKPGRPRK